MTPEPGAGKVNTAIGPLVPKIPTYPNLYQKRAEVDALSLGHVFVHVLPAQHHPPAPSSLIISAVAVGLARLTPDLSLVDELCSFPGRSLSLCLSLCPADRHPVRPFHLGVSAVGLSVQIVRSSG